MAAGEPEVVDGVAGEVSGREEEPFAPRRHSGRVTLEDLDLRQEVGHLAEVDGRLEATCGGLPGFKSVFKQVQVLNRQAGVVCSGAGLAADDDLVIDQAASSDIVTINLPEKAKEASPPICMEGLTLGNFVTCGTPQLVAFGGGTFKDFLGVTCAITAAP